MKLHIEKMIYGGNGLAHSANEAGPGRAIFVPFTLPREVVEARITKQHSAFSAAELESIAVASADRVTPRCAHFGECGGCQYQHASYDAQLRLKQEILRETLERAGLNSLPRIEPHAAEPWKYRNRIRLRVAEIGGQLRAGYLRRGSTDFLPIGMCPIAAPLLWRAAEALLTLGGNAAQWAHAAEEVEFFSTADVARLQMTLFVRHQPAKGFAQFCEALRERLPELEGAGVLIMQHAGQGRKTQRFRKGDTWGADGLSYSVAAESYWVSRGGFFQVNRYVVETLVDLVTRGRRGRLAWDLYAGVGLFSRVLAKTFSEVVAVEASAGDLAQNLRGEGRRTIVATTADFLRQAALERERPELIVVDPPRAGVGIEACTLLARIKPPEIVYVSCDPTTLGRDLKAMVDSGYRLRELHMVDMFPQTFHQETVAVLSL
ncbi:23S rRNA (uracil(1939)-C(5))-methyltransferase RlmD [Edaphobacter aggregans]|uniref:23S rRNA (uracil(1939)-C(5))-methyltransferase RlmD n=1 Tax=Edaphobacter aggregans TaxID=570835 RepID=UPI0005595115|nr:23S rRNA (uracil(1939)-C(5))-methyltransferase RlmD [Edaphobacter aggregans]